MTRFYLFLRGLDDGVAAVFQKGFTAMETSGWTAPSIHRDAGCLSLSALAVFLFYAILSGNDGILLLAYIACALIVAAVEFRWVSAHSSLARRPMSADVQNLYRLTAERSRRTLFPVRLFVIGYLLISLVAGNPPTRLDFVGWVLVLLYWCKLYLLRCVPSLGESHEDRIFDRFRKTA